MSLSISARFRFAVRPQVTWPGDSSLSADCAAVTIAENGDKALNLLERPKLKSAYTVILTDVHMPKVRIRLGRPQCLLSP